MKLKECKLLIVFTSLLLASCSVPNFHQEQYQNRFKQYGYGHVPKVNVSASSDAVQVNPALLKKYADRIAFEIAQQIEPTSIPYIAIASLVDLDDSLTNTHPFGNKLAEELLLASQQQGFQVLDYNVSPLVTMTQSGTFVFQRPNNQQMQLPYVLTGIISYTTQGININARLIATQTGNVIAAHSQVMPNFVFKQAFPHVEGQDIVIHGG